MSFYYLDGKIWVRHYQVRWRVDNVVRLRVSLPRVLVCGSDCGRGHGQDDQEPCVACR